MTDDAADTANCRDIATGRVGTPAMTKPKPGATPGRPKVLGDAVRTVSARLTEQEYRDLKTVAFLRSTTASDILRDLVREFLTRNPAPKLPKA